MDNICTLIMLALSEQPNKTMAIKDLVHHHNVKHMDTMDICLAWRELDNKGTIKTFHRGVKADGTLSEQRWETYDSLFEELDTTIYTDIRTFIERA